MKDGKSETLAEAISLIVQQQNRHILYSKKIT